MIKSNKYKKIRKIFFKAVKYIFLVFLIILIVYSIVFNINKFFFGKEFLSIGGISFLTEEDDDSMKPAIKNSDFLIFGKAKNKDLENGDIIAYEFNGKVYIQRICNVIDDNGKRYYITRGDNNINNNVEKIQNEQIVGQLKVKIPILGFIVKIFENKYFCLFLIIGLIYELVYRMRK